MQPITFIFSFFIALTIGATLTHILKVSHIPSSIGVLLFYIGFPLSIALVWLQIFRSKFSPTCNPMTLVLIVGLLYALSTTIFFGGQALDIGGNLCRLFFCISMAHLSSTTPKGIRKYGQRHTKILAYISIFTTAISVFFIYLADQSGYNVYFGLQCDLAFLGLAFGLVKKRWLLVTISLTIIILAGKRGVMLGSLSIVITWILYSLAFEKKSTFVFYLIAIFLIGGTLTSLDMIPNNISSRFSQFTSEGPIDWNRATAGRAAEIEQVLQQIESAPILALTGRGLGATIRINGIDDSTVHFTPLALLLIFGTPITVMIYFNFWRTIVKSGRRIIKFHPSNRIQFVWLLVLIGQLTFSFTAFTILQSYLLWISFAITQSYNASDTQSA